MTAAITDGLLLCTHDSARLIFGAAIVDRRGKGGSAAGEVCSGWWREPIKAPDWSNW